MNEINFLSNAKWDLIKTSPPTLFKDPSFSSPGNTLTQYTFCVPRHWLAEVLTPHFCVLLGGTQLHLPLVPFGTRG